MEETSCKETTREGYPNEALSTMIAANLKSASVEPTTKAGFLGFLRKVGVWWEMFLWSGRHGGVLRVNPGR